MGVEREEIKIVIVITGGALGMTKQRIYHTDHGWSYQEKMKTIELVCFV